MENRQTTPKQIGLSVKRFLKKADLRATPRYLPFIDLNKGYRPRYCLNNCESEQSETGCSIRYGWVLWENKTGRFIEAEFHAVAEIDGELRDITPRIDGEEVVLFVPDATRQPTRIDHRTWQTWSNIKSHGGRIDETTRSITICDVGT